MRNKIIAVNAVIVALVGLLAFVLVRASLGAAANDIPRLDAEARHDAEGGVARFELDGFRAETWLETRALDPAVLNALTVASPDARGSAATSFCNDVLEAAKNAPVFESARPAALFLLDATAHVAGRSTTTLDRGADLGSLYPGLKKALTTDDKGLGGVGGVEVWFNRTRNDQFLAAWAPVRDGQGHLLGAIALGLPLNDELSQVSDVTSGRPLSLVTSDKDSVAVLTHSANSSGALDALISGDAKDRVKQALTAGGAPTLVSDDFVVAAAALTALSGARAAIVVGGARTLLDGAGAIPGSILGVTALGLILVVVGGWLLGAYISRPINQLEEGLLAILNGQQDKRFELDHAELGGLAFRIDQLLNQLMGIEEDNTDADGRPSRAPTAQNFTDALAVEDRETGDSASIHALAAESPAAYYKRIYAEYIAAKKSLGEQTDHVTEQAFVTRIQGMERDASNKYGMPVRYQVQQRDREVVLLAVPLPG
jgi:hypothetical protein